MLGSHSQRGFDQADHRHLDYAGENTFYGLLAKIRGELFRDEDFADLYCRRTLIGHNTSPDRNKPNPSPNRPHAAEPTRKALVTRESKMVVSAVRGGGPIGSNRAPSSTRVASILGIIGGDEDSQGGAVRLDELKSVQTC